MINAPFSCINRDNLADVLNVYRSPSPSHYRLFVRLTASLQCFKLPPALIANRYFNDTTIHLPFHKFSREIVSKIVLIVRSRDKPRICTVSLAWREIKAFVSTIEVLQYEQKAVTRAILSSRQREWIPVGAVCFERGGTRAKIVSKRFINSQRVH